MFSHKARHSNLNQQQIWVSIPTEDRVGLVSEEAAEDGSFILGIFKGEVDDITFFLPSQLAAFDSVLLVESGF